jgi:tetratricopeptide (TPR) repeat protein
MPVPVNSSLPPPPGRQLHAFTLRDEGHLLDAAHAFRALGNAYQAGFCMALAGRLQDAIADWEPLVRQRPHHWCLQVFGLMRGELPITPSFLGIRLFLEMDLWAMLGANRLDYAEQTTDMVGVLQAVHLEAPKLLAKPWLFSGYPETAYPLLHQGLQRLPHDTEACYYLGHYYLQTGNPGQASLMFKEALMINPNYWPAQQQLNSLATEA